MIFSKPWPALMCNENRDSDDQYIYTEEMKSRHDHCLERFPRAECRSEFLVAGSVRVGGGPVTTLVHYLTGIEEVYSDQIQLLSDLVPALTPRHGRIDGVSHTRKERATILVD